MKRRLLGLALALVCALAATPASARHQDHSAKFYQVTQYCGARICGVAVQAERITKARAVHLARRHPSDVGYRPASVPPMGGYIEFPKRRAAQGRGLITVDSAAGPITVAPSFAEPIKGFIADAVARGFKGRVHCFSLSKSHVRHSLHFSGNACDFAQCGWGCTVMMMHHVRDLVAKWGLRDGCSFGDCGHIDNGSRLARAHYNGRNLYGAVARYKHARLRMHTVQLLR
jgi:hypothetical protein